MSFFLGYSLTNSIDIFRMVIGLIIFAMITSGANLVNSYYDRFEDEINQPIRTEMLNAVGLKNMGFLLFGLYTIIMQLATLMGLGCYIIIIIAVLDSIFYSAPPIRFKKNMLLGMISFTGAVALPFLGGWLINRSILDLPPIFYIITYFFFTYFTVKNIPDYLGDQRAKIKTLMTKVSVYEKGVYLSFTILLTPYLFLLFFISTNLLEEKFFLLFAFTPLLLVLLQRNIYHKNNPSKLERLHTFGFLYAISFLNVILVLSAPLTQSIIWIAFSYCFLLFVMKIKFMDSRLEESQGQGKV
ncbi:MAG: UbiA family prenyltransferase [Candidatus Lokiarchaeota archaeon]|nr:UbiA family prenyltransferase [Candidatus Lokiarchaeota archaeon]